MKPLAKVTQLKGSGIRRMFDLAKGKENVISFVLGEPDFVTPEHIRAAAKTALDEGKTHYTDNAGIIELRKSIAKKVFEFENAVYDPDGEIIVSTGAMEVIYLAMVALVDPGDEVLISNPCYANYYGQVSLRHGIPVPVPVFEKNGFNLRYDDMKANITPKTKAILVNSPCNPTGAVADNIALNDIARIAKEFDLYVIFDAVYKHLVYEGFEYHNIATMPGMRERTLYVDSLSKSHAMTGWRLGYMCGPREIISLLPKLHEFMPSCVSTFSQYGAVEAFENGDQDIENMFKIYERRRQVLLEEISRIPKLSCNMPGGAFYAFVNIKKTGLYSQEFAERLLDDQGVVVAPGNAFGSEGEGFIRISYATSEDNIRNGMSRIAAFVSSL